mmetsp:Transcript_1611/g.3178  ORF Transcript_1611/g.3178 Transcript_1611/m.3178 type:complete len:80 (-) Transcript_1611:56-295(-)
MDESTRRRLIYGEMMWCWCCSVLGVVTNNCFYGRYCGCASGFVAGYRAGSSSNGVVTPKPRGADGDAYGRQQSVGMLRR